MYLLLHCCCAVFITILMQLSVKKAEVPYDDLDTTAGGIHIVSALFVSARF